MKKYSVLTFNFGNYDSRVLEVKEKSPNAEYVYITDNPNLKSDTWDIKVVENKWPNDIFRLCWEVRYNPFDYVNTDIVVRIDGSVEVNTNLDPLVQYFIDNDYEIGLYLHPYNNIIYTEYYAWVALREYPVSQANKILNYFAHQLKYNVVKYKGLAQYNIMIQRNDKTNKMINEGTMWLLKFLSPEGKEVDRLDQTIGSMVIQQFFPDLNIMYMGGDTIYNTWFNWYSHKSGNKLVTDGTPYIEPWFYNRPVEVCPLTIKSIFDEKIKTHHMPGASWK